ncbi:transporter substrate-binding domain-containing protein [Hoeflea alexandrii]|uniref:transporter substrate-binding domain-containing protein n=1 Tax=Hoeflea alexandrii TaxID=288436 RepID=UPI0022AF7131|nr:transporter substrate-binding domain-containing protein [Hoeflea alexandrii]MCZ4288811.1 transporter substrate-binding domain-containing protein [Hoeflea alexandrii]
MSISRRIVLAASAAALALSMGAAAQAASHGGMKKLIIGTEGAYPPFNNLESDGSLVGFDIDIAKALCEEMKVECEFVTQDWDGIIPALLAGKFDAIIASMSITDERREKVDFTNKYYNTGPAIAVPNDSAITEATDAGLAGKALGAQSSTTHSNYAEAKFPSADLKLYPTPDEYKLDIASGRIDAVIDDVIVLSDWLKSDDGKACCKMLSALTPDPVINGEGAGIAIRKGETELRDMFNAAIAAIRANGTYKTINDKYFDVDVYGD